MSNEAKILIGIAVATIAVVVGAAFFVGGSSSPTAQTEPLTEDQTQKLIREDSYVKGPADAKVTLIEFGDYQCPACGATYLVVSQILEEYKDQIKFVYREFPLAIHQNARPAAQAAQAAGAQGKYYEMYDILFQNQKEWETSKNPKEQFEQYADRIGLDIEQFKKDLNDKKFEEIIQRDIADGYALGVQATPTFFINGELIQGGLPYDQFKAKVEAALKTEK